MLTRIWKTMRDWGPDTIVKAGLRDAASRFQFYVMQRRFVKARIYDYEMLLDMEDRGISRSLILFRAREMDHKILLEKIVRPGMTIFDIGANIGYYVLMELGMLGSSGKVVAIEPSPSNISLLERNIALNGYAGIPVIQGAVSDVHAVKDFHLATQSNLNTFHDTGSGAVHLSGETIPVQTWTVPELMETHGIPDLIRMDVEGHEVEIIRGMLDAVRAHRMKPAIIFETHISRYGPDHDMARVLNDLFACGYYTRYLASSWQKGTELVQRRGYRGGVPIHTDGVKRVIFENIRDADAIDFICHVGGARTVVLEMKDMGSSQ